MKLEKVCSVWHDYCKGNKILKIILPLDIVLLFAVGVINIVSQFISFGSTLNSFIPFIFLLAVLLMLAKCNFRMLSFGIALYAVAYIWNFIYIIFKHKTVSYYTLIPVLIYGLFAFLSYKKSLSINS